LQGQKTGGTGTGGNTVSRLIVYGTFSDFRDFNVLIHRRWKKYVLGWCRTLIIFLIYTFLWRSVLFGGRVPRSYHPNSGEKSSKFGKIRENLHPNSGKNSRIWKNNDLFQKIR
jgi:hypothetical protein